MPRKKLTTLEQGLKALEKQEFSKAEKKLLIAVNAEPENYTIFYYLAVLEFLQHNRLKFLEYCDEYIKKLRKYRRNYSKSIHYYYARIFDVMGLGCLQNGEYKEADECFKEAMACDPLFFSPVHNYGLLKYKQNNFTQAIRLLNKSLKLTRLKSDKAFIYHTLANCYDAQGRYKIAVTFYQNALKNCNKSHSLYAIIRGNYQSTLEML